MDLRGLGAALIGGAIAVVIACTLFAACNGLIWTR